MEQPKPPVVRIEIDHTPATGETEIRFPAGGQQFAAGVLLDVVGQLAGVMVAKDPTDPVDVLRGIVKFQLNTANQVIAQKMKPGEAQLERIQKPIQLVGR